MNGTIFTPCWGITWAGKATAPALSVWEAHPSPAGHAHRGSLRRRLAAALPAAAAIELIHNFSLIHDDIEDNSPLRRGRATVWALWGIPQAINTGDALFTLGHLALHRLAATIGPHLAPQSACLLQETCLKLTQGQYLDIAYEKRNDLSVEAYWLMVGGKTAALLECCAGLGALAGQAGPSVRQLYQDFGRGRAGLPDPGRHSGNLGRCLVDR